MDAIKVIATKENYPDGMIIEIVVWEVPAPVLGSPHRYKYRLFFGRRGQRIVGFDNERGKGDHMHIEAVETDYKFIDLARLISDFRAEVARWRSRT